jgi:hypothetical protein
MTRLVLVISMGLAAWHSPGQRVVPIHQEPRHHLLHDGAGFRVLDVQLASGDTTLFHTHDTPITYVSIDASAVNTQPLGGEWADTDSSAVMTHLGAFDDNFAGRFLECAEPTAYRRVR